MRKLCTNPIAFACAGLGTAGSVQGAVREGPGILDRATPGPAALVLLALGLGLLMVLSVPRDFGEAVMSELRHRLGKWIAHT